MTSSNIRKAILSLKLKNSEGYDRIPLRVLLDGISNLMEPFEKLFNLIYTTNTIPEQWSMSKVIPIHKKGTKTTSKITDPFQTFVQCQIFLKN